MDLNLPKIVERLRANGAQRVVVNFEGDAMNPARALREHRRLAEIVFIRNDGWSLGAPSMFERVAYGLWRREWVAFWYPENPSEEARPISEYPRA